MKKTAILLYAILFTAVSLWGQTSTALFQEARQAFSEKQFSRAVGSFNEFINRYPDDPRVDQADYMIGVSYFYLKQFDRTIRYFSDFDAKYPGSAYLKRIHYWIGISRYANDDYRNAIDDFNRQIVFTDEIYFLQKSYQFLGYCYEKTGQSAEAITSYQKLLETNPDKTIAAQSRERQGVLYMNLEEYGKALEIFSDLTVNYRDVPQLLKETPFYMGECYFFLGEQEQSIQKFESFLSLYAESQNREKAIFRLGSLYALNDNFDAAKEYMNLLNDDYPDSEYAMDALIVLAEGYMQSGEFETARESLKKLLTTQTDPLEVQKIQYNLARSWQDNTDKSLEWYLLASKGLDPDIAAESLYESGRIYDEKGERERTILLYEKLFNQYKKSSFREVVGQWMAVYYDSNTQDLALKNHLDRMLTDYPRTDKKELYLYMRGNIAYREKDYNAALQYYQNILNLEKTELSLRNEARYRIGYIYTVRKEFTRAKGYFTAILENSDPGELHYRALLSAGICSLNIGETDDAVRVFTSIIETEGSVYWKGDAYFYLGKISMDRGRYMDAASFYSSAADLASYPDRHAESLYQLGWSYMRLSQFRDASLSFDTLASSYPDNILAGDSLYRSGLALSYLEEWKSSLDRYLPALEKIDYASMREELLYQISWSHFMMEDFTAAMEYLQGLQNEFPDSPLPPDGLFRAAEVFMDKEKIESAVYAYQQLYYLFPENPLSETALFRALSFTGNLSEKFLLMNEYLTNYPSENTAKLIVRQLIEVLDDNSVNEKMIDQIRQIQDLPVIDDNGSDQIELALLSLSLKEVETLNKLNDMGLRDGMSDEIKHSISLYKGLHFYQNGDYTNAERFLKPLVDTASSDIAARAQFTLAGILLDQELWKNAADAFLRIRYRFPKEHSWISKGMYEAVTAYRQAGDNQSSERTREMLISEYPDSQWALKAEKIAPDEEETANETMSETNPDILTPPEEVLPALEEID